MDKKASVSLLKLKDQPYLYLFVDPKTKNGHTYLIYIDKEYGGTNSASIPKVDLNPEINYKNYTKILLNEFLIGAYYKNGRELIICTADTQIQTSSNRATINLFDRVVYRVNKLKFYNVSKDTCIEARRPDLYFSPEVDITGDLPYSDPITDYKNVLDNNNKFCWNKELIRPFSKFFGTPCVVLLQGNIEAMFDDEPKIIYMSKFIQNDPFNFNIYRGNEERECRCELIFPPIGTFSQTSHSWTIIKSNEELHNEDEEDKDETNLKHVKRYFNEEKMKYIRFNIQDKFTKGKQFDQYQLFEDKLSQKMLCEFKFFYSTYQKYQKQKKTFYLIGNDLKQLANVSLFYCFCYIHDICIFSNSNPRLFNEGTNSAVQIPIKETLFHFLTKCVYNTTAVMNSGKYIVLSNLRKSDIRPDFYTKSDEFFIFQKFSKSEKFELDPLHTVSTYFKPNGSTNLIKMKVHFQEELVLCHFSIRLRHRDPNLEITMRITVDNDTTNHFPFCPKVLLPNPESEEVYVYKLREIADTSLLYPVDYKCFQKTRFVTFHFNVKNEGKLVDITVKDFEKIIRFSDLTFVVKRPINKQPQFELVNNHEDEDENEERYKSCPCLDGIVKKEEISISTIQNFELTRMVNGVFDYYKCNYLIINQISPVWYDFRSYFYRKFNSPNICPFCDSKLPSSQNIFYEVYQNCPLFIYQVPNLTENSFPVCEKCHKEYLSNHGFSNDKDIQTISSGLISSFVNQHKNKNKNNLININEYIDRNVIELPAIEGPKALISQNVNVYRYSLSNVTKSDVEELFTKEGTDKIKFAKEFSILIFFQSVVIIDSIDITVEPENSISYTTIDPNGGAFQPGSTKFTTLELRFTPKKRNNGQEISLKKVEILGSFLPPQKVPSVGSQSNIKLTNFSLFDCKSKYDDKFKSVQTLEYNGIVKGYRIQVNKGQKLTSLAIVYYHGAKFKGRHFIMLPSQIYSENKVFEFPADFSEEHDTVKIFHLDRQACDSVNVKIITKK